MIEKNSFKSVWDALEDSPGAVVNLKLRSELMREIKEHFERSGLTQSEAATVFGVSQPQLKDLLEGRIEKLSPDHCSNILTRVGLRGKAKVGSMDSLMQYPYSGGFIRLRDAISLIVSALYSKDSPPRVAEKRVWQRIKDAGKGWLKKDQTVEAAGFFTWAAHQKKWTALTKIEGLPLVGIVGFSQVVLPMIQAEGTGFQTPLDPVELRIAHDRCQQELLATKRENAKLKASLAESDRELDERRACEAETRRKKSEAGKEGGGVVQSNPDRNR